MVTAMRRPASTARSSRERFMPENTLPPRFLRTPEAARFLGLSARTLEKHRTYGTGPTYYKLGGRVVYALDELKLWTARGTRQSTSDPGNGTIYPAKRRDEFTTSAHAGAPHADARAPRQR
jgi:predicted DNA-binding transcriptional regulator AlpA